MKSVTNRPVLSGAQNSTSVLAVVEWSQSLNLLDAGTVISLFIQVGCCSAYYTCTDMENHLACYGTSLLDQKSDWECDVCTNEKTGECHVVSFAIS